MNKTSSSPIIDQIKHNKDGERRQYFFPQQQDDVLKAARSRNDNLSKNVLASFQQGLGGGEYLHTPKKKKGKIRTKPLFGLAVDSNKLLYILKRLPITN